MTFYPNLHQKNKKWIARPTIPETDNVSDPINFRTHYRMSIFVPGATEGVIVIALSESEDGPWNPAYNEDASAILTITPPGEDAWVPLPRDAEAGFFVRFETYTDATAVTPQPQTNERNFIVSVSPS